MKMWHLIKNEGDEIALEAVVWQDNLALKDYTDDGYRIVGVYDVKLLEGQEMLPTDFQGERQ